MLIIKRRFGEGISIEDAAGNRFEIRVVRVGPNAKLGEWITIEDAAGNRVEIRVVRIGSKVIELGFRDQMHSFAITRVVIDPVRHAPPAVTLSHSVPSLQDEPAMQLQTLFSFISNALLAIQANPALATFLMNEIQALLKQFSAAPATTAHTFQARAPRNLPPEPFTPESVATWAHAQQP